MMSANAHALALGVSNNTPTNRLTAFLSTPLGAVSAIGVAYGLVLLTTGTAHAGSTNVFSAMFYKAQDLFYNLRYLSLLVGAIAVIAIMVGAFAGKFPVQKAIVFSFAIIMIASSGMIVSYFASGGVLAGGTSMGSSTAGVGSATVSSQYLNDTEGAGAGSD